MSFLTGNLHADLGKLKSFVQHPTTKGGYGLGTFIDVSFTPVPQECRRILKLLAGATPGFTRDQSVLDSVTFEGDDLPNIPGPVKSVAMTAVIHAMAGIVGQEISALRGNETGRITVNTDHAGLWLGTPFLATINGRPAVELLGLGELEGILPITDKGCSDTPLRYRSWAIYKTKTPDTWYQIHGSLAPGPVLKALGIDDADPSITTRDQAYAHIQAAVEKYTARELEMIYREGNMCGVTCFSPQAWRDTGMGASLVRHPLICYAKQTHVQPTPAPPFSVTADKRPLAGIKVVELARVIAAPALCAGLAAFGADVVRVMAPHAPDVTALQLTLTVGKRECSLDLKKEEDRAQLHKLLEETDVVIQGYRKGTLERKGFGLNDLLEMASRRGKGIIYIDENCFGSDGIYAEVPGWQQIADAAAGSCYVMGKAYGFPEGTGVLPSLPIADMSTGAVGMVTTMLAIRDRAKYGGSYHGNVALTAYNAVSLLPEIGLYQPEIVKTLQEKFQWASMTPNLHVEELLRIVTSAWVKKTDLLERDDFFVEFEDTPFGKKLRILGPVVKYSEESAQPRWLSSPKPYRCDKEVRFSGLVAGT
ncbi:hypothetical protein MMC25_004645 [Agyrium rufum]|nr:hypothetical protein [Agyrium rufum]